MPDWTENLITDGEGARRLLRDSRRVAGVGIKAEAGAGQRA